MKAVLLCLLTCLAGVSSVRAESLSEVDAQIVVDPRPATIRIPLDFVGLSYETSAMVQPLSLNDNANLKDILSVLGSHGVVRFGGNTSDTKTPPPIFRVTDAANFVKDLGPGWSVIFGLPCSLNRRSQSAAEAQALSDVLGKRATYQIGNEPNLYVSGPCSGGFSNYKAVWQAVHDSVVQSVPDARFAGADGGTSINSPNDTYYGSFAKELGDQAVLLTEHLYEGCDDTEPSTAIPCAWQNSMVPKLIANFAKNPDVSRSGLPLRLSESGTNDAPGVGDTLGSAIGLLWEMQLLAQAGWSGIDVHGGDGQFSAPAYAPVFENQHTTYAASPTLYAMVMFNHLAGGHILNVDAHIHSSVSVLAVRGRDTFVQVLILNKSLAATRLSVADQGMFFSADALFLTGAKFDSTKVSLGGSTICCGAAAFRPEPVNLQRSGKTVSVDIPASSAVLITFH